MWPAAPGGGERVKEGSREGGMPRTASPGGLPGLAAGSLAIWSLWLRDLLFLDPAPGAVGQAPELSLHHHHPLAQPADEAHWLCAMGPSVCLPRAPLPASTGEETEARSGYQNSNPDS